MSHFTIEFGGDVIPASDPETGEQMTRRVWFVAARRAGSTRYWPDYVHASTLDCEEDAQRLVARIASAWGATPTADRFADNPNWTRNTAPNPMDSLRPFGEEWEREQYDRLGL
jgi:hypothetical protein